MLEHYRFYRLNISNFRNRQKLPWISRNGFLCKWWRFPLTTQTLSVVPLPFCKIFALDLSENFISNTVQLRIVMSRYESLFVRTGINLTFDLIAFNLWVNTKQFLRRNQNIKLFESATPFMFDHTINEQRTQIYREDYV